MCVALVLCLLFLRDAAGEVAIVSAAGYQPVLAPGSIGSVFGRELSPRTAAAVLDQGGNLPLLLDGVEVQLDGSAVPLIYTSPGQINFVAPSDSRLGLSELSVLNASVVVQTGQVMIVDSAPGIFVLEGGRGAVLEAISGSLEPFEVTSPDTADGQTRLAIYATGLNTSDQAPRPIEVFASVAGRAPIPLVIEYAGPQRQFRGLDQINVVLSSELEASGEVQLTIRSDVFDSNPVPILVRGSYPPQ